MASATGMMGTSPEPNPRILSDLYSYPRCSDGRLRIERACPPTLLHYAKRQHRAGKDTPSIRRTDQWIHPTDWIA